MKYGHGIDLTQQCCVMSSTERIGLCFQPNKLAKSTIYHQEISSIMILKAFVLIQSCYFPSGSILVFPGVLSKLP